VRWLTATVVEVDALALSQSGLELVVPLADRPAWRWPVLSVMRSGTVLRAQLGAKEKPACRDSSDPKPTGSTSQTATGSWSSGN
jgi:hypothetical protein